MSKRTLKPAGRTPAPAALPDQGPRPGAGELRQIAAAAGRDVPPATPRREAEPPVIVNIKVRPDLAYAIAERAATEGVSQKLLICRALAAYGLPVGAADLEDRTRRRFRPGVG